MKRSTWLAIALPVLAGMWTTSKPAHAFDQTYESCSLAAWGNIQALEDYLLDVPLENQMRLHSAADYSGISKLYQYSKDHGPTTAFLSVFAVYAACTRDVRNRTKATALSSKEAAYYDCADASASRMVVLDAIREGEPVPATKAKMGPANYELIDTLYRMARERSLLRTAWDSSEALSQCVSAVVHANKPSR